MDTWGIHISLTFRYHPLTSHILLLISTNPHLAVTFALLILLVPAEQSLANMDRLSELTSDEAKIKWDPLTKMETLPEARLFTSMQRQEQREIKPKTPGMNPDTAEKVELQISMEQDTPVVPTDDLTGNPDSVNDDTLDPPLDQNIFLTRPVYRLLPALETYEYLPEA
nr:uncharacterized protein LOC108079011 isoform X2 [Drosophila kikkawai]